MPSTKYPLVFEFSRKIDDATGIGSPMHYYDGCAQDLFIDNGQLATKVFKLQDGHWKDTSLIPDNGTVIPGTSDKHYGDTIIIVSPELTEIDKIRFDHVSNGSVYFSIGEKIFRYKYSMDLSPIIDSWDYTMQSDSPVNQFNSDVQNTYADIFRDEMTLFQPGSRITVAVSIGGSPLISYGETWLDECEYDIAEETVSISSRNKSGYYLKDQTLDENHTYENTATSDVLAELLSKGGVSDYLIETNDDIREWETKETSSILDAISDIIGEYDGWAVLEDWKNKIYIGSESWLFTNFPNGNFVFNSTKDVFKRKTTRSADSAFVKVMVSASGSGNKDQPSVTKAVSHYAHWNLGKNKTQHITAPDGISEDSLDDFAEKKAKELQYSGIKEDITLSFHPEILVGDVGTVVSGENDTEGIQLGLITEIKHSFSKKDGWKTNIMIDSGGEYTAQGISMINQAAKAFGSNRKQTVLDVVKMVDSNGVANYGSAKNSDSSYSMSGSTVEDKWNDMS